MTDNQIAGMLKDVALVENKCGGPLAMLAGDLCCHVKALASYVEELQKSILEMENAVERQELLMRRKNAALDVFASELMWNRHGDCPAGGWHWNGDNEYRHPQLFAAKERDAEQPDER